MITARGWLVLAMLFFNAAAFCVGAACGNYQAALRSINAANTINSITHELKRDRL